MKWCIFYNDNIEISNLDCEPQNVPTRGVLVIAQLDKNHGWKLVQGGGCYLWDDRGDGFQWYAADNDGRIDYELKPGWKKILYGIQISNSEYAELFGRVKRDPRFPRKTAFDRRERKPDG